MQNIRLKELFGKIRGSHPASVALPIGRDLFRLVSIPIRIAHIILCFAV